LQSIVPSKLTYQAEFKLAKQQQHELQRSAQFLDTILTNPSDKREKRFTDPPNPPPQAPLPEKPFEGLRRADTEKPKAQLRMESSMSLQLASLTEALSIAKREAEEHRQKLTDMEKLLVEERVKRENAEARAKQLEKELDDPKHKEQSTTPIEEEANSSIGHKKEIVDETTTAKLQKRLEQLLSELQEAKASISQTQEQRITAEKERDDVKQQKSELLELVEKYRKQERELQEKSKQRPKHDTSKIEQSANHFSNGNLTHSLRSKDGGTVAPTHLVQATPYLSAFSVVLLGVAIMTLVNKMSQNGND
jgi:DNA repair exonuclease SbcCD ATPase subunit